MNLAAERLTTPYGRLPEPLGRRLRHVHAENARVDAAVEALRFGGVVLALFPAGVSPPGDAVSVRPR